MCCEIEYYYYKFTRTVVRDVVFTSRSILKYLMLLYSIICVQ